MLLLIQPWLYILSNLSTLTHLVLHHKSVVLYSPWNTLIVVKQPFQCSVNPNTRFKLSDFSVTLKLSWSMRMRCIASSFLINHRRVPIKSNVNCMCLREGKEDFYRRPCKQRWRRSSRLFVCVCFHVLMWRIIQS